MTIRTQLKAGRRKEAYNNHNEAMQTRTGIKAGKKMRLMVPTTVNKEDRLDLMVVRAGLRAGARFSRKVRR